MKTKVKLHLRVIAAVFRFLFSLRYKVSFHGYELVTSPGAKLFLPNHPALIEPVLLAAYIHKHNYISPAISAKYYRNPVFKPLLKLAGAIPIADLSEGERDADVYKKLWHSAKQKLDKEHYILFYPSGQLAAGPREKLYNKQGAFRLVAEIPSQVKVVGVRIKGFWGSRWSKAGKEKTPDFLHTLLKSIAYLALHGFFFCPKRKVTIEFVDLTTTLKKLTDTNRKQFNTFLENFYNEGCETS